MPNTLNLYDPLFYAQEAIAALQRTRRFSGRVYRGFDRAPQDRGSVINISKPSTFVAQAAPSTAQDLTPGSVQITLNKWMEVKFALTDKELTFSGEKIINDHIAPAAYALALSIDSELAALAREVPWFVDTTSPASVADITAARKVLFNNGVPLDNKLHMIVDGTLESEFLNLSAFSQQQGAGDVGVGTQENGSLGRKFGFEVSASQNVASHIAGVSADAAGALVGAHAAGGTTVTFNGVTIGGTFKAGDSFVIAGNAQRYVLTADATADGAGAVAATAITPPLAQAYAANSVITFSLVNHVMNVAFHENAFALAMAPLSTMAGQLGARVETVVDDESGIALRSRVFYIGDTSKVYVALDCLYGVRTLDPNMAVRLRD